MCRSQRLAKAYLEKVLEAVFCKGWHTLCFIEPAFLALGGAAMSRGKRPLVDLGKRRELRR